MPTVALVGPELFPIPPLRGGATEQFIEQLAHRLKGWRPVVIGVGDPELPSQEVRGQVEYRRVALTGWRKWLYTRHRGRFPFYDRGVADIIRQVKPDLVHVHNRPLLALYLKERLPQIPLILHMHNLYTILGKREKPAPGTLIPVEAFVGCSRFVVETENNRLGAGAGAHLVIHNGVDPEVFRPWWEQEPEARSVRKRYGVPDAPAVLFVGKIRESKGVGVLLTAMEQVWRTSPQTPLVLVGGAEFGRGRIQRQTPFLKHLQERLEKAAGPVILTGFIPPAHIHRAFLLGDIFVGPSQNEEGLGMVFLEAAASGLPIITTKMGGIPEFVLDGVNGLLLARPDDAAELADKISALLADAAQRRRLGEQGRKRVLEYFSWEKIAQRQEAVYDEVALSFKL
jgi:glycosyltransferase involved in cell wall biosynthesis